MIIYLMFMVSSLKRLRKISKDTSAASRRSRSFYLAGGLEASLIGYMVSSFFASVAYLWYVYYLVAYASCLLRLCQDGGADEQNFSYREESGHADPKWQTRSWSGRHLDREISG